MQRTRILEPVCRPAALVLRPNWILWLLFSESIRMPAVRPSRVDREASLCHTASRSNSAWPVSAWRRNPQT